MKTPRFWYSHELTLKSVLPMVALLPLAGLFWAGTFLRRRLAKPYRARVPVICIGNVVAGGAGKTPTALAIAQLLKNRGQKPVFVTRGYGGIYRRKGDVVCVDLASHAAADVGDEALLLAGCAPTWVGADRVAAIRQAERHGTHIIMDDGLQNPTIAPTVSFLVVDGDTGLGNGCLIPAGPLRESFASAIKRVTALIIIGVKDRHKLGRQVSVPVFRAEIQPFLPPGFPRKGKFVAFAGIGRPEKFYATARELGLSIVDTYDFPDHHMFTQEDIDALRLRAEECGARLLTTEKDGVRLSGDFRAQVILLPVSIHFADEDDEGELARLAQGL